VALAMLDISHPAHRTDRMLSALHILGHLAVHGNRPCSTPHSFELWYSVAVSLNDSANRQIPRLTQQQ